MVDWSPLHSNHPDNKQGSRQSAPVVVRPAENASATAAVTAGTGIVSTAENTAAQAADNSQATDAHTQASQTPSDQTAGSTATGSDAACQAITTAWLVDVAWLQQLWRWLAQLPSRSLSEVPMRLQDWPLLPICGDKLCRLRSQSQVCEGILLSFFCLTGKNACYRYAAHVNT